MNRSDVIERVAELNGLSLKETATLLDAIFDTIAAALAKGEDVQIHGFGTFSIRQRPGKRQCDRRTGEQSWQPPHAAPHFRPGLPLLRRVR